MSDGISQPLPGGLTIPEVSAAGNGRSTVAWWTIGDGMASAFVHLVFIVSGLAALIYQVVWQRSLMMIYGSNVESVAMVVSAFLIGLGIGSIAGGELSKRNVPLVLLFSTAELLIGAYGIVSLDLFHWVSTYTLRVGTLQTGLLAFALVFVPTLLMGSTLPLLVAYRVKETGHVGKSVSWLYFVNTLGGGLGAFVATFILLRLHGMAGAVKGAALLNVISAFIVLGVYLLRRRK